MRCEHAVKVDERVARRRDQGSEARDELHRRHHSVRLVLTPWSLQTVGDAPVGEHGESLERKWRASAVAEEKLAAERVPGRHCDPGMNAEAERLA